MGRLRTKEFWAQLIAAVVVIGLVVLLPRVFDSETDCDRLGGRVTDAVEAIERDPSREALAAAQAANAAWRERGCDEP